MMASAHLRREQERQRDYFDRLAAQYDELHLGGRGNRCHRNKILRIHRWLEVQPGQRILEVGVGTGIHALWLRALCPINYVGVDVSAEMLRVARRRLGSDVELRVCPAESLPFDDGSFDGVFCSGALHHFENRSEAIRELGRVVRPHGRVVLSEPNCVNPLNLYKALRVSEERGVLDMRLSRVRCWSQLAGLREVHKEWFNFTPPKPACLAGPYGMIDRVCAAIPLVRRIASMLLFVAEKQDPRNSAAKAFGEAQSPRVAESGLSMLGSDLSHSNRTSR